MIQVKRHRGTIHRPVLDQLRGWLHRFNAVRGTIITTGRHPKGVEGTLRIAIESQGAHTAEDGFTGRPVGLPVFFRCDGLLLLLGKRRPGAYSPTGRPQPRTNVVMAEREASAPKPQAKSAR